MADSAVVLCVGVVGCAVGPDYRRQDPPADSGYTSSEVVLSAAGAVDDQQRLALGRSVGHQWWQLFESRDLDQTLALALSGSPTLEVARATLAQAQQAVLAARGAFFPQVDLDAGASRERIAAGSSTAVSTLFSIGPVVSYGPDLFGRTRRLVEQQTALAEFQRYELAAAYLTVTGNVVTQALAIASVRDQMRAAEEIIAFDRHNLELVEIGAQAGKVAKTDVLLPPSTSLIAWSSCSKL